jgi:hypothetical protein
VAAKKGLSKAIHHMEELAALPLPTEEIPSEVTKHQEQTEGCINKFRRV